MLSCNVQFTEECTVIQERVKKYIAERNTREGVTGSGSGYMEAPTTATTEVPVSDNSGAPTDNAGNCCL